MRETWVSSLGQEDPLEKEMAIHSSIPAWRIPWTEEPDGLQSMGPQELDMTEVTYHAHTHISFFNKSSSCSLIFSYLCKLFVKRLKGSTGHKMVNGDDDFSWHTRS